MAWKLSYRVTRKHEPLLWTGSTNNLRTGPWTTHKDPCTDHSPNKIKNTNIKISLTTCPDHLCRWNFKRYAGENVWDLGSVSGASYIISHCHFYFAVAINIHERLGNLLEASKSLLLWVHFLCHFVRPLYFPAGLWIRPRLHNLLSEISNINTSERPKITSKISDGPEKQKEFKWFIFHLFLPFIHDYHAVRREKNLLSEGWDEPSNTQESGRNNGGGREGTNFWGFGFSWKATAEKMANM